MLLTALQLLVSLLPTATAVTGTYPAPSPAKTGKEVTHGVPRGADVLRILVMYDRYVSDFSPSNQEDLRAETVAFTQNYSRTEHSNKLHQVTIPVGRKGPVGVSNEGYWGVLGHKCGREKKETNFMQIFEGQTMDRYRWTVRRPHIITSSVGDVKYAQARFSAKFTWGKQSRWTTPGSASGLGLMKYLDWCEDLGMQAIMAVWSGYSLDGLALPEGPDLDPYVQQAIDQIGKHTFASSNLEQPVLSLRGRGGADFEEIAALRASLGHPDPYPLTYVEIGNKDFFSPTTYTYCWPAFVDTLTAEFPNLHFIATTDTFDPILSPDPLQYDIHVYQTPTWFAQNSFFYDGFEVNHYSHPLNSITDKCDKRNATTYFEGEYAAISLNSSDIFGTPADRRLTFPTMQSSSGEAAFMTGLERNADIGTHVTVGSIFAPSKYLNDYPNLFLRQNVVNSQWTPNLVSFDAANVYPSTSYYAQKLFSLNRGDEYIPSTLPDELGTLFWSVVRQTSTQEIIIKVSNTVGTTAPLTFVLPFATVANTGTAQVLTGAATASNTPTTPNLVVPKNSTIPTGKTFSYNAPGFSVSVLTLIAH
ncbi:alpha-L-arabinofuranosidase C-terminus-domain-containing protein [Mycena maculata]|uniref:non-reducing end alpha-L-arabinofuranosidase n=1 Tax=Mycena maculata TaxID=230809 RepID=A0AAD7MHC1_9AGAR|nr:alpha-L-arabinofuranosidase C-terminus-domain-containing protein [Mycena maculata]